MEKLFQVRKNGVLLDSGAADLGHRLHLKNGTSITFKYYVSRAFSFDINFSKDNKYFIDLNLDENPEGQRNFILSVFEKYSNLFSSLIIYAENTKYDKRGTYPNIQYIKLCEQKLHWHGYIRMTEEMSRKQYTNFFEKKIRPHFTHKSQTNPHRATAYKKISDGKHLSDRKIYMTKQADSPTDPIIFQR